MTKNSKYFMTMMADPDNTPNCLLTAIKYISGVTDQVCRLCFAVPNVNQETNLEDIVSLSRFYYNGTTTIRNIFKEIGISFEEELPDILCMKCSVTVINAYLFRKFCQHSDKQWKQAVDSLSKCVPPAQVVNASNKTCFIVMNVETSVSINIFSNKNMRDCNQKDVSKEINRMIVTRNKIIVKKSTLRSCKLCKEVFNNQSDLFTHKKHCLGASKNQCNKCEKFFSTSTSLRDHLERVHYAKVLKCPKCDKMFSTKGQIELHKKKYHEPAVCTICNINFPNKYEWSVHWDKHKTRVCPKCNKSFNNRNSFGAHKKVCGLSPKYICHHCGKTYCSKDILRLHIKEHGFGKLHICKWCNKGFYAISRLKEHIVKHTKEKNFGCDICGGSFVSRASLIYHRRLHTGEKPYPCELCEEKFISSSRRLTHMRVKHFAPTNICKICQTTFTRNVQLRKHMTRHYDRQSKLYKPELITETSLV